ncbi:MAG: sulfurtransferase [Gloeomargarita sp. SKYBB_i_bin120]|nr:sulfurtransferase [Gloeomargarita sp. SKYG98]MCS7292417.1 sulfurtransferase [Gloeomargarita sp. SKYB120]MDW8177978.1 sulfurtransferase [Gloeomargarita sp. SKYBB_i_bin120]
MAEKVLLSPQELFALSVSEPVVIIDTRDPKDYAKGHIPNAVNIREIFTYLADSTPEGIASMSAKFADIFGAAGLSGEETAVVYEEAMNRGFGQSCRGYFLLKYLGYPRVMILHGGYQAWLSAGLPISTEPANPIAKKFPVQINPEIWLTKEEMLAGIGKEGVVILDVRDRDEWLGESSSPYGRDFCPRKGRIPGAVWIEWYNFMDTTREPVMFKSGPEILEMCRSKGVTPDKSIYVYCFKGSRASNTLVALKEAGFRDVRNYFASWNEWSRIPELPIETGQPAMV